MASLSAVLSTVLTLLWGFTAAGILLRFMKSGRDHKGTEEHVRLLWIALAILTLVTGIQAAFNATGAFDFRVSISITLATAAAGLLLAHYELQVHRGVHGTDIQGAAAAGAILMATGAGAALVTGAGGNIRLMSLLEGMAVGAIALAYLNARHLARTRNAPAWVGGFALVAAYGTILGQYFRVLTYNAALQGGDHIWGYSRLLHAGASLLFLLFAAPALGVAARKWTGGEGTRTLTPDGPPDKPDAREAGEETAEA